MDEIINVYAGFAKVTAEKQKILLQRDMAKTLNASQQVGTFMDFYQQMKSIDKTTTIESALDTYNKIVTGLK